MKLTCWAWILLLIVFFANGCAVVQPPPTQAETAQAIARGDVNNFLKEMEAKATDAERSRNWALAAGIYTVASRAALSAGQLQKSLS